LTQNSARHLYSGNESQYYGGGDSDDIKRKLKELFNYYASFGDRLNVSNLKSSKFHKMMQDAGVISALLYSNDERYLMEKKKLDLIFC
jgi:hypothetical protein